MKQVDHRKIIALERELEEEVLCPECKIGVMVELDQTHFKCTYCKNFVKKKEIK